MSHQKFVNVYDEFRTIALNQEYYALRAHAQRKKLLLIDCFMALFAAGSAVVSWQFWKESPFGLPIGPIALGLATGLAAVIATLRPYLKMEDELERLSTMQGAYAGLSHAMEDVVTRVKTSKDVDLISEEVWKVLRQVRGSMTQKEDAPAKDKVLSEVQAIINKRYPMEWFYYPPDGKS